MIIEDEVPAIFTVGGTIKFCRLDWCLTQEEADEVRDKQFKIIGISRTPHSLRGIPYPVTILLEYKGERRAFSGVWFDPNFSEDLQRAFHARKE